MTRRWVIKQVAHSKRDAVRIVDWHDHSTIAEVKDAAIGFENRAHAELMVIAPRLLDALRELYSMGEWQRTISEEVGAVVGHAYANARKVLEDSAPTEVSGIRA